MQRGGQAAVIHGHADMNVRTRILQKLHFHLVFLELQFNFVTLFVRQLGYQSLPWLRFPSLQFGIQYKLPLVSTLHACIVALRASIQSAACQACPFPDPALQSAFSILQGDPHEFGSDHART